MKYCTSTFNDVIYQGLTAQQIDQRIKLWEESLQDKARRDVNHASDISSSNLKILAKEDKRLKAEKQIIQIKFNEVKASLSENKNYLLINFKPTKIKDFRLNHAKVGMMYFIRAEKLNLDTNGIYLMSLITAVMCFFCVTRQSAELPLANIGILICFIPYRYQLRYPSRLLAS